MADTLTKLFGSSARVKLLRLFLFNPRQAFTSTSAASRARVEGAAARREIALLVRTGIVEQVVRRGGTRYTLSQNSPYTEALQNLLLNAPAQAGAMHERFKSASALKLIVVSGMFMNEWDASLDLLLVGDRTKERVLERKMKMLEAEVGKEVRFATLSTADFLYRLNMSDKLLRDIFDYPHQIVYDRLDIGLK
jgi:hypothetical protein